MHDIIFSVCALNISLDGLFSLRHCLKAALCYLYQIVLVIPALSDQSNACEHVLCVCRHTHAINVNESLPRAVPGPDSRGCLRRLITQITSLSAGLPPNQSEDYSLSWRWGTAPWIWLVAGLSAPLAVPRCIVGHSVRGEAATSLACC